MTDQRIIEYRFLHWGPFVCSYSVPKKEITKLKKSIELIKDKMAIINRWHHRNLNKELSKYLKRIVIILFIRKI